MFGWRSCTKDNGGPNSYEVLWGPMPTLRTLAAQTLRGICEGKPGEAAMPRDPAAGAPAPLMVRVSIQPAAPA